MARKEAAADARGVAVHAVIPKRVFPADIGGRTPDIAVACLALLFANGRARFGPGGW